MANEVEPVARPTTAVIQTYIQIMRLFYDGVSRSKLKNPPKIYKSFKTSIMFNFKIRPKFIG